jgi:hypothetical protein
MLHLSRLLLSLKPIQARFTGDALPLLDMRRGDQPHRVTWQIAMQFICDISKIGIFMKNFDRFLAILAVVGLCFGAQTHAAQNSSAVSPETLAAAREAVANMQIIPILIAGGKAGLNAPDLAKKLTKTERTKLPVYYEAEVKSASARIIDRLAKAEVKKYSASQIRDILALSRGKYFQAIITATVNGKPTPPESELSDEEREIFARVGNTEYFKSFQTEVSADGGNLQKDMSTFVKRAFARLKK